MTADSSLQAVIVPVSPYRQNCALLFDKQSKKGVLLDPGAELAEIQAAIAEHELDIEAIWLTHGHIDHAAAAKPASRALGAEIYGPHKADKVLLDWLEQTAAHYHWQDMAENFTPDHWLEEGERLSCGGHIFQVLHTPGHAPGHVCYYCAAEQFAVVGDVLFRGNIGRTDLPFCNQADLINSIHDKLLPLGDEVRFICGHGPGSTFGRERRENPFLQGRNNGENMIEA